MEFKILASKNVLIGKSEDNLYSSFIEHLGRAVYEGIYDPADKNSDEDGFRKDVIEVIKKLGLSIVRYPGGNFVSGYFWEDGIGPKEKRPTKKEEAWKSIEPNQVGTDEFMRWAKKTGVETMMAVNLGNGTTESAKNLVQYCNADDDSKYANLRRENGHKEPYGIKYWGLGNEMDGDWQIGHLCAEDYVKKAKEAANKMREIDPNIKLIACGSSTIDMPTFPEWDRIVLDGLYDEVDYLSVHQYFFESTTENDFYASHLAMENYLTTLRSVLTYVQSKHRHKKDLYLCFDEYNVWYNIGEMPEDYTFAPHIIEEFQSFKDMLVFGGLTNALLNNCDIVKIACLAQLVNVIAPIMTKRDTEPLLNAIWFPFYNFCKYTRGNVMKSLVTRDHKFPSRFGDASYISHALVYNDNEVIIQLVNYAKEDVDVEINLDGFENLSLISHEVIEGYEFSTRNTFENPNAIKPMIKENAVAVNNSTISVKVSKSSYNFIRFKR